jgi:hypothetical protein
MHQKAHTPASPTVIFRSPRYLKYFLDHFPHFMNGHLPVIVLGHAEVPLPNSPTPANYKGAPVSLNTFMMDRTFSYYLSNVLNSRHSQLLVPKSEAVEPTFDHFAAVTKILVSGQRELPHESFRNGLIQLAKQFWPQDEVSATLEAIQRMQVSTRSVTPKRSRNSPEHNVRVQHQRRAGSVETELKEAQSNLTYTYSHQEMDFDSDKS